MKRTLLSGCIFMVAASLLLVLPAGCKIGKSALMAGEDAYFNKDYATALAEFEKAAAEDGDAKAQYYLSGMYQDGKGVSKDQKKADELMRSSADKGYAPAQVGLGLGYCAANNYKNAVGWFRKAVEQKDEFGLFFMGLMYARGTGVKKDISEALRYFRLAKEEGFNIPDDLLTEKGISEMKVPKKKR